ncbi:exostosin-2-like [Lingula anatina]|uniref:Exostosin-2-like n=1 Tax=Lingula anatina TaxID=7574 RepID=A0A1S3HJ10_LINAN|nr:exostosin-2-like [Lingula anatina]|eukprot:XP_013385446.1 exostosin-2-like [Lingula anatina]
MPTRSRSTRLVSNRYRTHYIILFLIILIFLLVTAFVQFWPNTFTGKARERRDLNSLHKLERNAQSVVIKSNAPLAKERDSDCIYHTCFDVYGCGDNDGDHRIKVYISPLTKYVDENGISITLPLSQEYFEILEAIVESEYFTSSPNDACLIVPPIDLLNQNKLRVDETSQVLASMPRWNEGINHLLFNMLPGSVPDFNTVLDVKHDKAIIAGGGFSSFTYRRTYDVSVPVYNPLVSDKKMPKKSYLENRRWLAISAQAGIIPDYRKQLSDMSRQYPSDFKVLDKCKVFDDGTFNHTVRCDGEKEYSYPEILQEATFCTVVRGARLGQTALSDALMAGCIPVVFADTFVMPFSEVLDWKRAALVLREEQLPTMMSILKNISSERIRNMRRQVQFLWQNYFSSMKVIALTSLQIINDRVFPYASRKYDEWNELPENRGLTSPLFFPMMPSKAQGFTAVILTYDRIDSLFQVIRQVAQSPSLAKVLVIWNNQKKSPPPASSWPKIGPPLKVIQTTQNLLSNRFYPHEEIQTEAILALDDDIVMLTSDELEFGYEASILLLTPPTQSGTSTA